MVEVIYNEATTYETRTSSNEGMLWHVILVVLLHLFVVVFATVHIHLTKVLLLVSFSHFHSL